MTGSSPKPSAEASVLPASAYTFGPQAARQPELECLLTDGQGGFSISSLAGMPTRRTSGLVVSDSPPFLRRNHMVSPIEVLEMGDEELPLHTLEIAPNVYEGRGMDVLAGATVWDLLPDREQLWRGVRIRRQMCMPQGSCGMVMLYEIKARESVSLTLGGYFVDREMSDVHRNAPNLSFTANGSQVDINGESQARMSLFLPQTPSVNDEGEPLSAPAVAALQPTPFTQRVYYRADAAAGEIDTEYVQGCALWRVTFPPGGGQVALVTQGMTTDFQPVDDPWEAFDSEMRRRRGIAEHAWHTSGVVDEMIATLSIAADAYLVRHGENGQSVISGYPYGSIDGRDAMMALTGLTLVTGRPDDTRAILATTAKNAAYGLTPSGYDEDSGKAEYQSADSALWFIVALERYARITADGGFIRQCLPVVREILGWCVQGTEHNIQADAFDGLLAAGEEGLPVTWMNAVIRGSDVTPRQGKAVELQGLWLSALGAEVRMAEALNEPPQFSEELMRARHGFFRLWAEEQEDTEEPEPEQSSIEEDDTNSLLGLGGSSGISRLAARGDRLDLGMSQPKAPTPPPPPPKPDNTNDFLHKGAFLADVMTKDGELDRSIRPNAAIALALADTPATENQVDTVIQQTEMHLATPVGLHSLSPLDPRYQGSMGTSDMTTNAALHQGSVWPWPLGAYVELLLSRDEVQRARTALSGLMGHVWEGGVGHITEVFDGDTLKSGGNPFQAVNLAELMRAHVLISLNEQRMDPKPTQEAQAPQAAKAARVTH